AENASWLVALCHGDLTRKNLLRAPDGRFWLVDLELARVMPIAVELGHLCADEPSVTRQALALLARLDPAGETIPPRLQLALGLVAELREQRRCQAVYVIDKVKMFGVSRSEAETKVRAEADGILDLIRAVASPS
ncbi:MAG: phosphotransferase, partial [Bauldia sp.]|nr:phosphotransferase [Bauldia sp.]